MAKPRKPPKPSLASRVAHDPALLARYQSNPGLRSQLPDKFLTPEHLKVRNRMRFVDDLGDISTPLSGDTMTNVAEQLTDRQYTPQFGELDRQRDQTIGQRDQQQRWSGDYSKLTNDILAGLGTAQGDANKASLDATGARLDATLKAIDEAGTDVGARAASDAGVRGAGLGQEATADQLAQQQATMHGRAQAAGQAAGDASQGFGDAQSAFLRNIQAVSAQRGQEQQGQIGAAANAQLADLSAGRRALQAQRGQDLTKNTIDLRKGEVERLLTEKGISSDLAQAQIDASVKQQEIRSQAQLSQAKMRLQVRLQQMGIDADKAKQMADQEFQGTQNELNRQSDADIAAGNNAATVQAAETRAAAGGKNKPVFSAKDLKRNAEKRDGAFARAARIKQMGGTRDEALTILTNSLGDTLARVAIGAIYDGGAKPHLDRLLYERFGVHVPRERRR